MELENLVIVYSNTLKFHNIGCMGGLNQGCLKLGGKVIGVIHHTLCVDFGEHEVHW